MTKAGTSFSDKDPTGTHVTKPFTMRWIGISIQREKKYSQVCKLEEDVTQIKTLTGFTVKRQNSFQ